jgi:hypothetical protein
MIDLREAAVGAWQNEVMQDIRTEFFKRRFDSPLADPGRNETRKMIGRRAKDQRKQQRTRKREDEYSRANACNAGLDFSVRGQRG